MTEIVNAAPMVVDYGTNDLSIRTAPRQPLNVPQHLPKYYIFAEKGPIGSNYMDHDVASITQIYGDDTFDVNKRYFTHQTLFVQCATAAANNCVIHRLVPEDAKDKANIALYLDVLPTKVTVYQKHTDGSYKKDANDDLIPQLDSNNNPIVVDGYKIGWVIDHTVAKIGHYEPGRLIIRNGLQTDGTNQSLQYPIWEVSASDPGEAGDKLALRIFPSNQSDIIPFPYHLLNVGKLFPFYLQVFKLVDEVTGKTNVCLTSFGQYVRFVSQPHGVDPYSGTRIDLWKTVIDQYINVEPQLSTGLGNIFVYEGNLKTVCQQFYDSEKNIQDQHRDSIINTTENNIYGINIVSFTSSNGSPYQSLKLIDFAGSTRLTRNTNLFLAGSTDGTITEELLDRMVEEDMENYNNSMHEYNDLVLHPESVLYDSGFTMATKRAMCKFISRRKDTYVNFSTFAHDSPSLLLADQYSVGVAIKTMVELYPESATFGTPVMRATITGGSGHLIDGHYAKRVALTYELNHKSSHYMGAKTGAWKNGFLFDRAPNSIITQIKDIDVTWIPASTRNTLWHVGINFALNYAVGTQFFPAIQTVYEHDTSVLNSYFTVVAIAYLNKIAHAAWREFSGSISLTEAQLCEKVNAFVSERAKDKFDGKIFVRPRCTVTEFDKLRGYSWTLPIDVGANLSQTVMTTYTNSYRLEDIQGNQP